MLLLADPLITAWVGPDFADSVILLQLLSIVVIVRVGNATGATLLKGAGAHRVVSIANSSAAVCNVVLSIALVRPLGLVGVALGTLVPVCGAAIFVTFPLACRRVELTVWHALTRAVWPSVWPGVVMAAFVVSTRSLIPARLIFIGAEFAAAGLVYAITFLLFSLNSTERHFYLAKLAQMLHISRLRPAEESL
jgi:O-antigen/teichoic acid export membrane protein